MYFPIQPRRLMNQQVWKGVFIFVEIHLAPKLYRKFT